MTDLELLQKAQSILSTFVDDSTNPDSTIVDLRKRIDKHLCVNHLDVLAGLVGLRITLEE